jgi:acetyl esterase/lipase
LDHEGLQVAKWLNTLGVTAFVLHYRHKGVGYQNPAPLSDAQRALRLVRYRAKEWAVDPNRIGVLGFSAGGHLASSLGTHFQTPAYEAGDEIDKTSCRPDFMALIYPVISMEPPFGHMDSRYNLLGKDAGEELVKSFCNQLRVTKETPPTFLILANDDGAVSPENSIMFYEALRKAEVPAEMHIFLKGGHGFGMRKGVGPAEEWINLCEKWMRQSGWLTGK